MTATLDPATTYALIAYAVAVTIGAVILAYVWNVERNEAERQADASNYFNDKIDGAMTKLRESSEANKTIAETNAHLSEILVRSYVRNKYGQLQRYDDWAINGDKEPKPRKTQAQKIKEMGDHFISEVDKIQQQAQNKTHHLVNLMQVINVTKKQKTQIYRACIKHGVRVVELTRFFSAPHVFYSFEYGVEPAYNETPNDINIPFDEFLARIKGEWKGQ